MTENQNGNAERAAGGSERIDTEGDPRNGKVASVFDAESYALNGAVVLGGQLPEELLALPVEIAFGRHKEDKHWKNRQGTLGQLLDEVLTEFQRGPKDGRCMLQGALTRGASQRLAKNMRLNRLVMLDFDTGVPIERVVEKVDEKGLFAVIWTTHSHLKDETEVPEEKVLAWLRSNGQISRHDGDATEAQVIAYLRQEKRIEPTILSEARLLGRFLRDGGRKFVVKHKPMPRLRILFVLKEGYDFESRAGSQQMVMEEWKQRYAGLSLQLGLPIDRSCVDPSRLMYTPRIAEEAEPGEGKHEIVVLNGGLLDFEAVQKVPLRREGIASRGSRRPAVDESLFDAFDRFSREKAGAASGGNESLAFVTHNLGKFLALAAHDFEAATWAEAHGVEGRRTKGHGEGDFRCPNEDAHTHPDANDTGFHIKDASANDENGFAMWCMHDTCKGGSHGDRAWYLDKLCVEVGVKDAMDLITPEWTPNVSRKLKEAAAAQEAAKGIASNPDLLDPLIAAVAPGTPEAKLVPILRAIGKLSPISRRQRLENLKQKSDLDMNTLKAALRQIEEADRHAEVGFRSSVTGDPDDAGGPEGEGAHAIPEDLADADPIYLDWSPRTIKAASVAVLVRQNQQDPHIFQRPEGGVMRISKTKTCVRMVDMEPTMWDAELDTIRYVAVDPLNGYEREVNAPKFVVPHLRGMRKAPWPYLDRIVEVPVFNRDGALCTSPGYDPINHVWLHPSCQIELLPEVIAPEDVRWAREALFEAYRDFPFSDTMDGTDHLPIKLEEVDEDGFRKPNIERGRSSRANCIAMTLQPFIRDMVMGNCPAYHIDKAAAGTGAGYLVDTLSIVTTGRTAAAQAMSENREEVKKTITSSLRSGEQIIFMDNINHKVDSGALAAAITSGTWVDRVLGVSQNTKIEMKALWVFAGNNVEFSHELMRRLVPIRLDAATPRPAQDRGEGDFKHMPLQDWVMRERSALVHACHILVAYWVQQGKPKGQARLNSFDNYAMVMSGILETAGIHGFLENVPAYLDSKDEEQSGMTLYVQAIWDAYGEHPATATELLEVARDQSTKAIGYGLPVPEYKPEASQVMALGQFLSGMVGKTFNVQLRCVDADGDQRDERDVVPGECPGCFLVPCRVKFVKGSASGRTTYRLLLLKHGQ